MAGQPKLHRCIRQVRATGRAVNPFAVCQAALGKKKPKKKKKGKK